MPIGEAPEPSAFAALGPFFAFDKAVGVAWHPLRALTSEPVLAARVGRIRGALEELSGAPIEPRVAASTFSLSLFARLTSPVVAAAVLDVAIPRPSLDATWWQPVDGGPLPLALTGPDEAPTLDGLLDAVIDPLIAAFTRYHSLSVEILHGNVASAILGAAGIVASALPERRSSAAAVATTVVDGRLAGAGQWGDVGFVRNSCCLYYRVPGAGYCGDCVLLQR